MPRAERGGPATIALAAVLAIASGFAALAGAVEADAPDMEELLVAGDHPGPALWQVRHGAHRLWVLPLAGVVPKDLRWRSAEVEARIGESSLFLAGVDVSADVSLFRAVRLLPALLRARKLPRGQTLRQVVGEEDHARFAAERRRLGLDEQDFEELRPAVAAGMLSGRAMEQAGLSESSRVGPRVRAMAKKAGLEVREPQVEIAMPDPRGLLDEYSRSPPSIELPCFSRLLHRLTDEMPSLKDRARAWAVGDIARLRELGAADAFEPCLGVVTALPRIGALFEETRRRAEEAWLSAAEGALIRHESTFAVVDLREVIASDGLLTRLAARGYEVVPPAE